MRRKREGRLEGAKWNNGKKRGQFWKSVGDGGVFG